MQVDSDLQSLEETLCETVDTDIAMETAQSMLDKYQPLASGLRENYPAMKELGIVHACILYMYTYISRCTIGQLKHHMHTCTCACRLPYHTCIRLIRKLISRTDI